MQKLAKKVLAMSLKIRKYDESYTNEIMVEISLLFNGVHVWKIKGGKGCVELASRYSFVAVPKKRPLKKSLFMFLILSACVWKIRENFFLAKK